MEKLQRIPFFRLLLPLLAGIVIQYYFSPGKWNIVPLSAGLALMLLSYSIPPPKQFKLRWIFGGGMFLFLFSAGALSTLLRQQVSVFDFADIHESYQATVIDIPQEKPNTTAYKVQLKGTGKKIVCYLPKDTTHGRLSPGDSFIFFSRIEPFRSLGNPGEFDYARYMYNKGYAGYTLVQPDRWEKANGTETGFLIKGVQYREKILNFYKTLDLTTAQFAMLSALTLGYKDALSDDVVQSFRATGTAHVLAVSGMHIGIVYAVILSLLGFIPKSSHYHRLKPTFCILLLWIYTFVIGFPPSAVRASLMLTAFCVATLSRKRTYSLNTLFATAFLMLVWNPFQLFDLGFQLSFSAVLSMLLLIPVFNKHIQIRNRALKYVWNLFLVSLAAQIGTFPLCLYYFGTFPTYFLLTNLLIIPLIATTIYLVPLIVVTHFADVLIPALSGFTSYIPLQCYKLLLTSITGIIRFFESLPYAQLQELSISSGSVFLIWIAIAGFVLFLVKKKPKALIAALVCCLLLIVSGIYSRIEQRNSLTVLNRPQSGQIYYQIGFEKFEIENISENNLLYLNGKSYMIITHDVWKEKLPARKYHLDYLHISGNNGISLYSLNEKFDITRVILDSSLSGRNLKRFVSECEKLRIPYYDVTRNGALRIFFY